MFYTRYRHALYAYRRARYRIFLINNILTKSTFYWLKKTPARYKNLVYSGFPF